MGRRWLGFSEREFERTPHNDDGPPPSIWWYSLPAPKRQQVVATYISRCARGGVKLQAAFKDDLSLWLHDLSRSQNLKEYGKPRTTRYWDLPTYALAHGIKNKYTFMKRFRELEKIAIKLFPDSVPSSRKPRAPLAEEEIEQIQRRCLKGDNIKDLAKEFRVAASKVGLLCREQKAIRDAARRKTESENPATSPLSDEMPF